MYEKSYNNKKFKMIKNDHFSIFNCGIIYKEIMNISKERGFQYG